MRREKGGGGGKSLVGSVPHCESPLSSRYPPCIIAMAHRVVAQWFVRCRIQYRPAMARFISKVHITPSHLHTISSPHPHTLTLTPPHSTPSLNNLTSSHTYHIFTPPHPHTLTLTPSNMCAHFCLPLRNCQCMQGPLVRGVRRWGRNWWRCVRT